MGPLRRLLCACIVVLGHLAVAAQAAAAASPSLAAASAASSSRTGGPRGGSSGSSSSSHAHFSEAVLRLLRQRRNVSAALQLVEDSLSWTPSTCARVSLADLGVRPGNRTTVAFQRQVQAAVRTANTLTSLSERIQNDTELVYGEDLYYTLSRMNVLSEDELVGSGVLVLHRNRDAPVLSVFAYRPKEDNHGIAFHRHYAYDGESVDQCRWFASLASANYTEWLLRRYGTSVLDVASGLQVAARDGLWTSPYYDCGVTDAWVVTFAVPFLGVRHNNSLIFRGVATVNIALNSLDINQCSDDDLFFAKSHRCNLQSAECEASQGLGFRRGSYRCRCREGFYVPGSPRASVTDPTEVTDLPPGVATGEALENSATGEPFRCLPCPARCGNACQEEGQACFVQYNMSWRSLALGLQSFCTTVTLVLMVIVFRLRKSKVNTHSPARRKHFPEKKFASLKRESLLFFANGGREVEEYGGRMTFR